MNIKVEIDKKELKEIKKAIDSLIKIELNEMDLTEENLKKAKEIQQRSRDIVSKCWKYKDIEIKIVSSKGKELTRIN